MFTTPNILFITLAVIAAAIEVWLQGKSDPRYVKCARLVKVLLLAGTLLSFYAENIERTQHLNEVLSRIERSLDKIEEVSVTFQATVSADSPEVADFRDQLIDNAESCLQGARARGAFTISAHCLPVLGQNPRAYRYLGRVHLLLDFCRPEKPRETRLMCEGQEADLALGVSASLEEGSLRLGYDYDRRLFVLWGEALKPYDFEALGDIVSITDLDNADLFLRLQAGDSESAQKEVVKFQAIFLDIKGAHTWSKRISRDQTSVVSTNPSPRFLYRIHLK